MLLTRLVAAPRGGWVMPLRHPGPAQPKPWWGPRQNPAAGWVGDEGGGAQEWHHMRCDTVPPSGSAPAAESIPVSLLQTLPTDSKQPVSTSAWREGLHAPVSTRTSGSVLPLDIHHRAALND
jgi:hypothetical protein